MRNYFFIILGLYILSSCNSGGKRMGEDKAVVFNINLDTLQEKEALSLRKIKYIPLETTDDCLIMDVNKVLYRDSLFYLFDERGNSVFVFNEDGIMVQKIHAIGNGPGEYVNLRGMDMDSEGNIWLHDLPTTRLIKYSHLTLQPVQDIKIDRRPLLMSVSDSGYVYFGDVYHMGGVIEAWLERYSVSDGVFESIMKNEKQLECSVLGSNYFYRSGDKLYFYKRYEPYIYRIEGSRVIPYINLISDNYPTDEVIEEWQQGWQKGQPNIDNKRKYLGEVRYCYETDDYIFIHVDKLLDYYYIVINKADNSVHRMKFHVKIDFNGRLRPVGVADNYFVGYYRSTDKNLEYLLSQEGDVENKDKIAALTEESNPILVLFTFDID